MADIPDFVVQSSLQYLEEGMGLQCISRLGSGSFGDVYKMKDAKRNREVAVKLVEIFEVYPLEWALWSRLRYKHIVPLLRVVDMYEFGIRGFVMPLHPRSLMGAVRGSSLAQVKRWLREVLKALEYLRRMGMCHLDVKSDNVLISADERALLCDFTKIRLTINGKVKRSQVGLPWIYCPPEVCREEGCERVDGERVDLWGFGALSLEVLTGHPIFNRTDSGGPLLPWKQAVFPYFKNALQEPTFLAKLRRSFPCSPLDEEEERLALDFVHGFLMTNPKKRVKPSTAMSHKFLNKGRREFKKTDPIWTESVEKGVETPVEKKKIKKGIRERLTAAWKRVKTLFKKKDRSTVEQQVAPDAEVEDSPPLQGGSIEPTSPEPPGDAAATLPAGNTKKWASAPPIRAYRALTSHLRSW